MTGVEDAGEIRVDHLGPLGRRHVGHVRKYPDAGVVDHEVQAAESGHGCGDGALHVVVAADVRLQRLDRAGTLLFNQRPRRRQMRFALPVMDTCAPSATSARAIARPIPRDPPVTKRDLSAQ